MRREFAIAGLCFGFSCKALFGSFDTTIPVVDMNDFYDRDKKQEFVNSVAKALHEVGFFAVINTHTDKEELEIAYAASESFFNADQELKNTIYIPSLNGQRGYIPGETAQGAPVKDFKEFLHIGRGNNIWPKWMDLENPMMRLIAILDQEGAALSQAFALAIGEDENFFVDMTANGDCLLRALHYPANPDLGAFWAAQHTDIDLFTILPMATEEGLQVLHNGEWISVKVPPNAFIVNAGDMLQNLTNGYFKSSWHRVVSKPNLERYSIVYFVHPRNEDSMSPREKSVEQTGGIQNYPDATRWDLLCARLREIKIASPALIESEKNSGFMDRVKELVESGNAAEPVLRTYHLYLEQKN